MTRFMLAAGVAALAIAAPSAAKPGHGGGHGNADHSQKNRGGGHNQARGGHARAHGNAHVQARAKTHVQARGGSHGHTRVAAQGHSKAQAHSQARAKQAQQHNRAQRFRQARAERVQHNRDARAHQAQRVREARNDRIQRVRNVRADRREAIRDVRNNRRFNERVAVGYAARGCPPGLARKAVACMPPGQARKLLGQRLDRVRQQVALRDLPVRLRSVYRETPDYYYRYGDDYVYRVNRTNNVVSSLLPLFGLGYNVGQPFPTAYNNSYLPSAYQPFYPQTPYSDYRYANGYVYQVNPYTGLIADVDPMLGYGYGYGQMLPSAYSAYNVPYQYRPYYYDTADSYYRYAPGAIYQVDPQTSLITAVASLLSPGLTVGQQLPMGYSAYNVPYAYRPTYYDTPNAMYRYANGNIYRVDPTTQLVTALVASALT